MIPTIAEAARLLAGKALSPVELMRMCQERIDRLDPGINAFLLTTPERALADARAAEARLMRGAPLGPLDGIPIAHKDIYNTAGIRTTAHSRLLADNMPDTDATAVARLAAAGTVMLGKLATHEFAIGGPAFDLPWPPARNPWNRDHVTAGSSSGTGAAVAAGLILGGTGSDTGGSIRGPAAFCGVAGIKPTYGRCSRAGVLPLTYSMDHTGPLAWTVEDCALLLQAMAGHDPADPASARRAVPDFTADLAKGAAGLRIGLVRHFHETDHKVNPSVQQAIDRVVAVYRDQGAEIREVTLPSLFEFQACGFLILVTEAFALHEPWMRTRRAEYGRTMLARVSYGALISGADYVQALRRRRELCAAVTAAMADLDLLLTAAAATEATPFEPEPTGPQLDKPGFYMPFNVTGQPAMTVCAGFGEGGLPVGIQLAAKPFQEALLLRACHAFQAATPWRDRRPAMAG
jgi:aspartyl-tRNA(Asn)/glutamyl-tRNA(Gln) amidotransferase subunit A